MFVVTKIQQWLQDESRVLILETSDLPVLVAPTPPLILTCLIFLFTGERVLANHSAEE